jgi:hypothetical protein
MALVTNVLSWRFYSVGVFGQGIDLKCLYAANLASTVPVDTNLQR